ncbi:flagellar FlbD family protein [Blastococcus sp. SYSU D00820]
MIGLTRRTGERCSVHPDDIQRVEACPDTVVFLLDGTHYCVRETVDQVIRRIRDARAGDLATCYALDRGEDVTPHAQVVAELYSGGETHSFPVSWRH